MMKTLSLVLILTITLNTYADCIPQYKKEIEKRSLGYGKFVKAGKITTLTTFGVIGGFYGVMGVLLTGPWWSFFAIGGPLGLAAAIPVGTTFFVVSKVKKNSIKKMTEILNLISMEEKEILKYYRYALKNNSNLILSDFKKMVYSLNYEEAFCNGTLRKGRGKLAKPKDFKRYLDKVPAIENALISFL